MRFLLLVVSLATALPAQAQPLAAAPQAGASGGQRVALGVIGLAGGLTATAVAVGALRSSVDAPARVAFVLLAYPVGATLTVQALGPLIGTAPRWTETAQDVVLGVAGGALVLAIGVGVGTVAGGGSEYLPVGPVVGGLVGGVAGVATAVALTGRRVRVAPAALAAPTGDLAAGLSLSLRL